MALALRFPNAATSNQRRQVTPSQGAVLDTAVPLPQIPHVIFPGLPRGFHLLLIPLSTPPSLH